MHDVPWPNLLRACGASILKHVYPSSLLIARDVITGIKEGEKAHSQNKFRGLDWGVCIEFCCFFLMDLLFHESKG